jgi:hypothetical protein
MRKDLQDQLYAKYPKIFRQKDLPMTQTAMCWNFECCDGWYTIIDELCSSIQNHIENENLSIHYKKERGELPPDAPNFPQVEATQVKEKFGGLRFYVNHYDDYIRGLIDMAESMSTRTCEYCGNPGKCNEEGWLITLCDPCRVDYDNRWKKLEQQANERLTIDMDDVTVAP